MIDNLLNWLGPLFATVGALVIGGGTITTLAFALFKRFGDNWLRARFDKQLEAYKHVQQKELEELRFTINALLDRTVKLHQREFDVLPEAWARLNDSYGPAMALVSTMQQYPELDLVSGQHLDAFLAGSPLQEWERTELREQTNKDGLLSKPNFCGTVSLKLKPGRARTHMYLRKNGIFILADIRKQFDDIDTLIWDAVVEREIDEQVGSFPRMRTKADALTRDGENLMKALQEDVQKRLWNSQSIEGS